MTAVDEAWHKLLYSLYVCSLAWHSHTDSWSKKCSQNGDVTSQEMWEAGVPKQGLQKDRCCTMCCTMAAAARATVPGSAAGCKPPLPFPQENTCFQVCAGLHVGREEAFTYLGSSRGWTTIPHLPLEKCNKMSVVLLNIYLKLFSYSCFHCVCIAWEHFSQRIILRTVAGWILCKFAFMDGECRCSLLLKWKSTSLHSR